MKLSIDLWLIQVIQRLASNDPTLEEFSTSDKKRSRSGMGDDGASALAVCLLTNHVLKKLDLSNSGIGPRGMKDLSRALKANTSIEIVILDNNKIGARGATALSPVLKSASCNITELSLFGCGIGPDGAKAVVTSLQNNRTIRQLDLGRNKLGNDGASAFAENIACDVRLKELDLSDNHIDKWGVFALSFWLHENVSIQILQLSGNKIGPAGACTLGKLLKVDWTLKELELNDCGIGNEGFAGLVDGLRRNEALTHLHLESNGITNEAISMFQDMLDSNQGVEVLVMDPNEARDDGFQPLPARFHTNQTLKKLEIYDGSTVEEFVLALINDIQHNTFMESQCFDENRVDVEFVQAVSTVLESSNLTLTSNGVSQSDIGNSDILEIASVIADNTTLECIEEDLAFDEENDRCTTELEPKLHPQGLRYLCLADNPIGRGGLASHITGLPYQFYLDKQDLGRFEEENDAPVVGETDLYHRWNQRAVARRTKRANRSSEPDEFDEVDLLEYVEMLEQWKEVD